jgi:hypothetical protein
MHRPANKMVSKKHQVPRRRVVINPQRVKEEEKEKRKKENACACPLWTCKKL